MGDLHGDYLGGLWKLVTKLEQQKEKLPGGRPLLVGGPFGPLKSGPDKAYLNGKSVCTELTAVDGCLTGGAICNTVMWTVDPGSEGPGFDKEPITGRNISIDEIYVVGYSFFMYAPSIHFHYQYASQTSFTLVGIINSFPF